MKKSVIFLLISILILSLAMPTVLAVTEPEPQEQTTTITTQVPDQGGNKPGDNGGSSSNTNLITVNFNAGGGVYYDSVALSNGNGVSVINGKTASFRIAPNNGYKYKVFYNGVDVTDQVKNDIFVTPPVTAAATLRVEFMQNNMPPSTGDARTSTVVGFALLLAAAVLTSGVVIVAKKKA